MVTTAPATKVAEVMSRNVLVAHTNHSFSQLCRMMLELNVHHLPVEDERGQLIGMISSNDILRAYSSQVPLSKINSEEDLDALILVEDMMTSNPMTIHPSNTLDEVSMLFMTHRFQSLPVVENGKLIGMITGRDVVAHCAQLY